MFNQRKKYKLLSDEDLVYEYNERPSREVIQILYERYGHLVLGLCIKYMKQVENAEDTCSLIFEKLPDLILKHEIRYFKSWLYQVSKNECLMKLRKKNPHQTEINESLLHVDDTLLIEKKEKEKEIDKMERAILDLKEDQKMCVTLFYLEDKSYQEISMALSMSINAVKSNIQNGKRNLKILMEAKP